MDTKTVSIRPNHKYRHFRMNFCLNLVLLVLHRLRKDSRRCLYRQRCRPIRSRPAFLLFAAAHWCLPRPRQSCTRADTPLTATVNSVFRSIVRLSAACCGNQLADHAVNNSTRLWNRKLHQMIVFVQPPTERSEVIRCRCRQSRSRVIFSLVTLSN